ncbi:hypothetical protein FPQ18DRAFT_317550 [Pyronema domesticum]|uniref:SAGA-associated factor 11 n=1 Tax=Pyronema omphalodes (strain CBS 100304) TaxID=1076935 RepID=U4LBV2_PYROM|nr:hypothetical protein FPQ18DRAFT_317550 [Pyronema domesticum]CCX07787.1 Similar to hypothetical protein [Tuber melanosporum Mel28]; acc. no. XP_002842437 [Pyronema omphalodes CBS 100304]
MSSASTTNDPAPGSLAALSLAIFSDLLSNLTHDLVLQTHRAEKLLRTQQQQHALHLSALSSASAATDPNFNNEPKMPPGNPLATIPTELICTRCNLPRHTQETISMGTILTESGEKKKFCQKLPYRNIRGCDIYGNPFPNPNAAVKKGATAAAAKKDQGDSPASVGDEAPVKVGKGTGIVYFKCTSCDHEKIASSRYAAHLEKCLGLSGRKSSRAAMQKMSNGGSNSGSPMLAPQDAKTGSRKPSPEKLGTAKASTPAPDESLLSTTVLATPVKPALSSTPTAPSTISNSTPKKKKKLGTAVSGGLDTKESTPVPSLPPPAIPVPGSTGKSAPSKEKKRKRKDEGSLAGDTPAKPKKQKAQAAASNATPTSTPKPKPKPAPTSGSSVPLPLAPSISPQKPPLSSTPLASATGAATLAKKPSKPKVPKAKSQQTPGGIPKKTVPGIQKDIIKDAAASSVTKDGSPIKKIKNPVKKKSTLPSGQSRPVIAGKSVPVVAGKTLPNAPARKTLPGSNNGA